MLDRKVYRQKINAVVEKLRACGCDAHMFEITTKEMLLTGREGLLKSYLEQMNIKVDEYSTMARRPQKFLI